MKKNRDKTEKKNQTIDADEKGLKALAKTLGESLYTDTDGKIRVRSDVAETPEHGVAVSTAVKVLKELAKVKTFACMNNGTLFYDGGFDIEAAEAVFNSRLLASGREAVA